MEVIICFLTDFKKKNMQTDLWFSQTGGVVPLLPYGDLPYVRVLPNYVDGENRLSMGLPMENATQEEIANDVGSIDPNSPLPQPTMPTQRGCGSNQYVLPFKIQGEEKCVDKTIAMVLGAIAIYYIVKK
ncbi:hypothetical protein N8587_01385 [Akkermansiaceae bacterium]|nr:hypothetical protein [Akkermansiaceae bacterium]